MKYLAVIAGIFGLETEIKNYVEKNIKEGEKKEICAGTLVLTKYHNGGAFLNAGQKKPKAVLFLSLILTLGAAMVFVITFTRAGRGLLKWGLTLLLGGACSNTYDRLVRKYVVDYVSFRVPSKRLSRIVFNIGDFCIMAGAFLSIWGYWRET